MCSPHGARSPLDHPFAGCILTNKPGSSNRPTCSTRSRDEFPGRASGSSKRFRQNSSSTTSIGTPPHPDSEPFGRRPGLEIRAEPCGDRLVIAGVPGGARRRGQRWPAPPARGRRGRATCRPHTGRGGSRGRVRTGPRPHAANPRRAVGVDPCIGRVEEPRIDDRRADGLTLTGLLTMVEGRRDGDGRQESVSGVAHVGPAPERRVPGVAGSVLPLGPGECGSVLVGSG